MAKKTIMVLICFIGLLFFISTLYGQGSKKTITLPGGEVVYDLNGEWDALYENLGAFKDRYGTLSDIVRITQQGRSFVAVKMVGTVWVPKGAVSIKGELDKNGLKAVQVLLSDDPAVVPSLDCKGHISEDGNKIILDGGERMRVTLTRK
jgi:hypothetical protein